MLRPLGRGQGVGAPYIRTVGASFGDQALGLLHSLFF